jgi:hypothetical protein
MPVGDKVCQGSMMKTALASRTCAYDVQQSGIRRCSINGLWWLNIGPGSRASNPPAVAQRRCQARSLPSRRIGTTSFHCSDRAERILARRYPKAGFGCREFRACRRRLCWPVRSDCPQTLAGRKRMQPRRAIVQAPAQSACVGISLGTTVGTGLIAKSNGVRRVRKAYFIVSSYIFDPTAS